MKEIMTLIIVCSFFTFLYSEIRKKVVLKINNYIQSKEYRKLENLLSNPFLKLFFSSLTLAYIQLESAIIEENKKRVEQITNKIMNRNLSEQRTSDLYFQIFDFYIKVQDYKKAKEYLAKINHLKDESLIENANMIYSIMIEHKDSYLEVLLSRVDKQDDYQTAYLEFLIAEIYKNKKEYKKEKEYRRRASIRLQGETL